MSKVYFSCPKFTVLLVMRGPVIVKAAPIVKRFEGQTIGALTSWAESKFGGPIIVQKLSEYAAVRSGLGYSGASSAGSSRRASNSSETSMPSSSRSSKSISSGTR